MSLPVTVVVTSVLAAIFLVLVFRVIQLRYITRTSLGDGGDAGLMRAIRGHGNFNEYAPLFIALLLVGELTGVDGTLLWLSGTVFCLGRALHGYCFGFTSGIIPLRSGGMVLTVVPMAVLAVANLVGVIL